MKCYKDQTKFCSDECPLFEEIEKDIKYWVSETGYNMYSDSGKFVLKLCEKEFKIGGGILDERDMDCESTTEYLYNQKLFEELKKWDDERHALCLEQIESEQEVEKVGFWKWLISKI